MRMDGLGTKLMVALATLLLLGAACGKSSDNSGAGAGGSTTGTGGSSGSGGAYGGGAGGYGSGGNGSGSSGGSQSGGTSVATIQQNNFSFDPSTFTVQSGDTITIKNGNANTPHTFTIKGTDVDVSNDPLASQDVTIDLAAGTYEFICTFHVQSGMKGTLTVT
jgi:plastocyanin